MRTTTRSDWLPLLFTLSALACSSATGPTTTTLVLSTPPNFVAVVTSNTLERGNSPAGYVSQHNLWVTIPSAISTQVNAGVVVGELTPVFLQTNGRLVHTTASSIRVSDVVQVWHDQTVAYGTAQAPPDAPAYSGQQIVILR